MKIYDYKGRKNISGNRIREARLKKRLSQADFAAKLQIAGITMERDSVSRIEIGTRFVADYELMIALNVNTAQISAKSFERSLSTTVPNSLTVPEWKSPVAAKATGQRYTIVTPIRHTKEDQTKM